MVSWLSIFIFLISLSSHLYLNFLNTNQPYIRIDWCEIPAGHYLYGSTNDTLLIYYKYHISKNEITNKQYLEFLNQALSQNKIKVNGNRVIGYYPGDRYWKKGYYSYFYYKENGKEDDIFNFNGHRFSLNDQKAWKDHPVKYVTWFGANAFSEYFGLRLPTNYEWEKAARGLIAVEYPWGDTLDTDYANYLEGNDILEHGTTPVGYYNGTVQEYFITNDNSSIYGVFDMIGNVAEWTDSFSEIYSEFRTFRGGSWRSKYHDLKYYPTSEGGPRLATNYIGFRCVK